jgi:serine/threonine protein kinase
MRIRVLFKFTKSIASKTSSLYVVEQQHSPAESNALTLLLTHQLVMAYCDGGTVQQLVRTHRLEEPQAAFILRKVIRGIAYLHSSRVVHRDIKSENILLNRDTRVFIGMCQQFHASDPA